MGARRERSRRKPAPHRDRFLCKLDGHWRPVCAPLPQILHASSREAGCVEKKSVACDGFLSALSESFGTTLFAANHLELDGLAGLANLLGQDRTFLDAL